MPPGVGCREAKHAASDFWRHAIRRQASQERAHLMYMYEVCACCCSGKAKLTRIGRLVRSLDDDGEIAQIILVRRRLDAGSCSGTQARRQAGSKDARTAQRQQGEAAEASGGGGGGSSSRARLGGLATCGAGGERTRLAEQPLRLLDDAPREQALLAHDDEEAACVVLAFRGSASRALMFCLGDLCRVLWNRRVG